MVVGGMCGCGGGVCMFVGGACMVAERGGDVHGCWGCVWLWGGGGGVRGCGGGTHPTGMHSYFKTCPLVLEKLILLSDMWIFRSLARMNGLAEILEKYQYLLIC